MTLSDGLERPGDVGESWAAQGAEAAKGARMTVSPQRLNVLYVAGTGYSGSTLLAFLFNSHPQILSIGEMGPAQQTSGYPCSCGRTLEECPFFVETCRRVREMGVEMHPDDLRLGYRFSRHRRLDRLALRPLGIQRVDAARDRLVRGLPAFREWTRACLRRNETFIRAALDVSGAHVFMSTHKSQQAIPILSRSPCIHLRVVHLIRDPRAFVCSSMRHHPGRRPWTIAAGWARTHRSIERHMQDLPPADRMRLRYEDLCSAPEAEFDRICRFAGAPRIPLPQNFRDREHHIIGNPMRLGEDGRTTIRLDERWKREMDAGTRTTTARWTSSLARRYGYAI